VRCEKRQEVPPEERMESFPIPEPKGNPFSWQGYNEAQTSEKLLFLDILEDLCSEIQEVPQDGAGRPRSSRKEMAFCLVAKLYEGLSSRRVSSDLQIAMNMGHIFKVPHFNTILKYFNDPAMAPLLTGLIRLSAMPLRSLEESFAVDASGLSSAFNSRWLDYRFGKEGNENRSHDWIKIHVMCGIKTNIVTAINVTDGHSADSPQFPDLVGKTAEHFNVKEVSADKGYSSKKNIETVLNVGGIPYIDFRSNTTGRSGGSSAWRKMFHYFMYRKDAFMERYHKRSNVESTFSMLKRKFSSKLKLKNEVGQLNEALAMVLCHNICVLIKEIYANDVEAEFKESAHLFPSLHINYGLGAEKA
jgi:transposase